ncbi:MAG TPA: ROK family transcriptional regulator [Aggregatilineales bacterium]|nr:ROK family transcriptional regulator [Aggregatilineales bacterium]
MRAINRNLVLTLIHAQGPLSRTDIARESGLGNATVSQIAGELVSGGLVEEIGEGESTGGRRPLLLRLNPQAGYVVGVKMMEGAFICAITDLQAEVIARAVYPTHVNHSLEVVQDRLNQAVQELIRQSAIDPQRLIGIGIGLAGIIRAHEGIVSYSPYFDWHEVDLAGPIAERFGLPVYLENDVNTLTIAEQWFGHGRGVDHFAVVTVGRGIGSGMVINGQFCRDAAGEIGHVTLVLNGPRCDCGKRGCLEAVASDPAVIQRISEELARGRKSVLAHDFEGAQEMTLETVIRAAEANDALAVETLEQAGTFLGIGIANLINVFSPPLVIVSGEGLRAGKFRLDAMHAALEEHVFNGLRDRVRIVTAQIEDTTWARGAASLVLEEIFKSPMLGDSKIMERLL